MKTLNIKLALVSALSLLASVSAFAYGGFTAIVIDQQTGAWGSFHGAYSYEQAVGEAQNRCTSCTGGPVTVTWARNGWAAMARSSSYPNVIGTAGIHSDQYSAEQDALNRCNMKAGDCYVVRSLSSFVNGPDYQGTLNQ